MARRTRDTPGRVHGSAAGRPSAGHPCGPVDVAVPEPGQRIPDVRGISPPQHRTDVGRLVTGTRVRPRRPVDQGTWPGVSRVRVTSPHATVEARAASPPGHYRPGAMPATDASSEMGDGNEYRQTGNGRVIRANGVIGSRTQGPRTRDFTRRGTAGSAALIRSTSTPGGHHEHH